MHKKRLATGLRLGPQGELTALPHFLQLDFRGSFATENDGQVAARGNADSVQRYC